MSKRDSYSQVSESLPFDNDTNGFVSDNAQEAIEEVNDNLLASASISCQWTENGTAQEGDYLKVGDTSGDDVGMLVPWDGVVAVFNASNDFGNGLKELEIERRRPAQTEPGVVIATLSIPNGQFAGNSFPQVPVLAGDELLVRVKDPSADFDDVICSVVVTRDVGGGGGGGGGGGEANTASNLGSGEGLFAQKSGVDLQFKSVVAGTNMSISSTATEVTFDATGEANTGSNLGAGAQVFAGKVGVDFEHRTITGTGDVTVSQTANTINIDVPANPSLDPDVGKITTAVETGGGQVVTGGALVTFDTTSDEATAIGSHTPGATSITINKTGVYQISGSVALNQTSGNSRSAANYELRLNGSIIPGSANFSYHRNNAQGEGGYSYSTNLTLSSGDVLTLFASRNSGGATLTVLPNSGTLSVMYLRSSN